MHSNPFLDPFVEAGYFGYAVRCIAHRTPERRFQPSVEIRDCRDAKGAMLYECSINQLFADPDAAIARGMREGRQSVDEITAMNYLDDEDLVS